MDLFLRGSDRSHYGPVEYGYCQRNVGSVCLHLDGGSDPDRGCPSHKVCFGVASSLGVVVGKVKLDLGVVSRLDRNPGYALRPDGQVHVNGCNVVDRVLGGLDHAAAGEGGGLSKGHRKGPGNHKGKDRLFHVVSSKDVFRSIQNQHTTGWNLLSSNRQRNLTYSGNRNKAFRFSTIGDRGVWFPSFRKEKT